VSTVAIDMSSAYRAAVWEHLPHATLVVDHFHVVQLANQVVSSVRRRVTATLRGRRARKDDPEYGLRRRLLRNREDLTEEKFADMWNRLVDLGPAGGTGPGRLDREGGTPRAVGVSSHRCLASSDFPAAVGVLSMVR
jgi:transposase